MMVLVIQRAFPSFLSFQISLKNCTFLDFIPVILASFRHSGVIPKFSFNWSDAEMTNDFGLKLTTFPCGSQNGQAFQKCVHLVFQNLPLSVNSKLTSRSQCEPFLQLESDLSRALSKTLFTENCKKCQSTYMSNMCQPLI